MVASEYAVIQENSLSPSYTAGDKQASGGCIMLKETFSRVTLEPLVVKEQTVKAPDYLNITAD